MQYQYRPSGVCSRQITIDVENGVVQNVSFVGGCNGNLQGIGALVQISWHRHSKKYRQKLLDKLCFYTKKSAVRKDSTSSGFFIRLQLKSRWYYLHRPHPLPAA